MDWKHELFTKQYNPINNLIGYVSGGSLLSPYKGKQSITPLSTLFTGLKEVTPDQAMTISVVAACVNLISNTVASMPIHVFRMDGDNKVRVDNENLPKIINSPNLTQTRYDFFQQVLVNYLLNGNAYVLIVKRGGMITNLTVLPSNHVEVELKEDGSLIYEYSQQGNKKSTFKESQIIHIRGQGNGLVGVSTLHLLKPALNLAINVERHTFDKVSRGARRAGVMMVDGTLTDDQRQRLRENYKEFVSGNTDDLQILEAMMQFVELGEDSTSLQLSSIRHFANEQIARVFGVPSILVNDKEAAVKLGSSTSEIIQQFHKLTIRPLITKIELVLQKRLLTPEQVTRGYHVRFNADALLRANVKERAEIWSKWLQNGVATRAEIRRLEQLEEVDDPNADVLTVQSNLIPLSKLGEQNANSAPAVSETEDQETIQQ